MKKRNCTVSLLLAIAMLLTSCILMPLNVLGAVDCPGGDNCCPIRDDESKLLYSSCPGLTVKELSDLCSCDIEEESDKIITTGMKVTLEGEEYTLVLMGDCAPDGKVDTTDIITLKRHMLNVKTLEGCFADAVRSEKGKGPGSTDYIKLKRFILGITERFDAPKYYDIPDFTDMTREEAETLAAECGLAAVFETILTNEYAANKVFSQDQATGRRIISGNTVTLKIAKAEGSYTPLNYSVMKAMWLSQFDMGDVYCSGKTQRSESDYRARVDKICKSFADNGFNTAILQVRPNGDSFYPSEIYTPSYYVTGSYSNGFTYDPLKIFIDIAHSYKISVQGWLNPLRLMGTSGIRRVSDDYLIGKWYQDSALRSKYLFYDSSVTNTSYYYLNPAYEEVRQMIIDGAVELCEKYDIDGVHFDDYFYPTDDAVFDKAAYQELGNGMTLSAFRKNNINMLVKGIYSAIKNVDPDIIFGISPAGNISNNRGYLSADIDTWGKQKGYVDYLMPQLYWGFEYSWSPAKYENIIQDWKAITTNPAVKLIPGLPFYKTAGSWGENDGDEWQKNKDVLKRMVERAEYYGAAGFCGFSYSSLFSTYTGAILSATSTETNNLIAAMAKWN